MVAYSDIIPNREGFIKLPRFELPALMSQKELSPRAANGLAILFQAVHIATKQSVDLDCQT